MKSLKVRLTTIEDTLGTASSNPDLHHDHIASKSADKDKVKEEMAALPAEELEEKAKTVFFRDSDGGPAKELRWIDNTSPWVFPASSKELPKGWGDIEIGPMID